MRLKKYKSTKSFPGGGARDVEMAEAWRCGNVEM